MCFSVAAVCSLQVGGACPDWSVLFLQMMRRALRDRRGRDRQMMKARRMTMMMMMCNLVADRRLCGVLFSAAAASPEIVCVCESSV